LLVIAEGRVLVALLARLDAVEFDEIEGVGRAEGGFRQRAVLDVEVGFQTGAGRVRLAAGEKQAAACARGLKGQGRGRAGPAWGWRSSGGSSA